MKQPVFNKTLFVLTGRMVPGSYSLPTLVSFLLGKEKCNHSRPFSTGVMSSVDVCVCVFALCILPIKQLNNIFIYKCISKSHK